MSSPVALVCTHPKPSAGRLAPVWGSRVTSQPAGQEGLEPPTAGFGDRDSSQLSYCPLVLSQACSRRLTEDHQMLKCTLPTALPSNHRTARQYPRTVPAGAARGPRDGRMLAMAVSTRDGFTAPRISARIAAITESATLAVDAKARAMKAAGRAVIGFGAGEPDFPTPGYIVEAAQRACANPRFHKYSPTPGLPELREAIAAKTERDSGLHIQPGQVLVTNGGKQAVYEAFATLLDPGDEVLLLAPYWTTYPEAIALAGGVSVEVFAGVRQGFKATVDQLEAARTPRTKVLLMVSPSNPTGAVYSP